MRIVKLLLFGLSVVLVAMCFTAAWDAAQDTGDLLSRTRDAQPDFVLAVGTTPVQLVAAAPQERLSELVAFEWVVAPAPEAEPEPKPITRRRRAKRPAAMIMTPSGLVAPEDAIRLVLRGKRSAFEHCYEQALKQQAPFDGFVVVSLSLSLTGRVTDAHVEEGTRRDGKVGACIVALLRQVRLPPLTEEAELLIPIRLQAKKPT